MEEVEVARMPLLQTKDSAFLSLKESGQFYFFQCFFVRKMIDLQACFPKCKKVTLPCDDWYKVVVSDTQSDSIQFLNFAKK